MPIKDKLQINLITYNRKKHLQRTLEQILADNSPIRDFDITILDNASTDGSSELIDEYCAKYPNLKHIRRQINIGGNANICRAFELGATSGKEYFWVLCDDDKYDFSNWNEVESILNDGIFDAILVEKKYDVTNKDWPYIINTTAFLPSTIYKSDNVTSQVLQNMYCNIYVSFPHLSLSINLLNNNKKFTVGPNIIEQNINMEFTKGCNNLVHFRQAHVNLFSGYINSYQMIKNKNMREKCCNVLWIGKDFYYSMRAFWNDNGLFSYNACDIFNGVTLKQKLIFLFAMHIFVIDLYKHDKNIYLKLFNKLKIRIFAKKWFIKTQEKEIHAEANL